MIAFSSDRGHDTKPHSFFVFAMQRTGDIYTMTAQGDHVARLTTSEGWDGSPEWSSDDSEIFFYSDRHGDPALFKMKREGGDQESISPASIQCLSPQLATEGRILFTCMNEAGAYSILSLSLEDHKIDSSLVQTGDMFNVDYHSKGLIAYHGGAKPSETASNKGGFDGDLLIQNSPEEGGLPGKNLELYGVRRAFAAPPMIGSHQLVYDHMEANGLGDLITPFVFPVAFLPLLALFWFFFGVTKSIRKRKKFAPWKYLLFSILSPLIGIAIGFGTFNRFVANAMPISDVKAFLFVAISLLLVLALAFWYGYQKREPSPFRSFLQHSFLMLASYFFITSYSAVFIGSFLEIKPNFYAVNYQTNEVTHLFQFDPPDDLNPQLVRIIDSKFSPDGNSLQFSVGGFRKNPATQGYIYRYHLENKTLEAITDGSSNNAFADFSKDKSSMVFRSGRTGNMDIFLQEGQTLTNLTQSDDRENFPVISHDGNKVAYCSDANGTDKNGLVKTVDIYLISRLPDNSWSKPEQLTSYSGQEGHPHFSPDGEWLIYASEEFGINDEEPLVQPYIFSPQMYGEITAIRLEDKQKFRLTHNKWEDGAPLWKSRN